MAFALLNLKDAPGLEASFDKTSMDRRLYVYEYGVDTMVHSVRGNGGIRCRTSGELLLKRKKKKKKKKEEKKKMIPVQSPLLDFQINQVSFTRFCAPE